MPLVKVTLKNAIWSITEPKRFGKKYPVTKVEAVQRWADCFEQYVSTIFPQTTTQTQAIETFRNVFKTYEIEAQDALLKLSAAVHSFSAALSPGMLAGGFTAVPPPVPPDFTVVYNVGINGGTAEDCAAMIAEITDAYLRTGTATPVNGGPIVNWN